MPAKPPRQNECGHPERPHYAKGKCHSCYCSQKQKLSRGKTIHTEKPEVANHVANAIIMNNMDTEQAVKEVIAPNLTASERADLADKLKNDPKVLSALEKNLAAKGLDEGSKAEFVAQMWDWLLNGDSRKATAAARILGRGFIGEKVNDNKPIELKVVGLTEGVAKMMAEAPKVELPPEAGPEEEEEEDGEENNES